jgi:hypothetical protein
LALVQVIPHFCRHCQVQTISQKGQYLRESVTRSGAPLDSSLAYKY